MYESFYKFRAKPFQLTPDPRFYYPSSGHKRAMSYLRYGLNQGEGFVVVTGDIGTGKSILARALLAELANENVMAAQIVTTQLEADDVLRMVASAFGLPDIGISKGALLKEIERFLVAHVKAGKRVLLVVDEAQNLPLRSLEELRMLSNFQLGAKALLPSFLLGQKEFRKMLLAEGLEQLRQRVIAACHLSPLSMEETKNYIEHRLRLVGWQDRPSFTEEAYQAIYQVTAGTPRRINLLCDRLLLYGFLEEQSEITQNTVSIVQQELMGELSPMAQAALLSSEQALPGIDAPEPVRKIPDTVESRLNVLERNVELIDTTLRRELGRLRRAIPLKPQDGQGVARDWRESGIRN